MILKEKRRSEIDNVPISCYKYDADSSHAMSFVKYLQSDISQLIFVLPPSTQHLRNFVFLSASISTNHILYLICVFSMAYTWWNMIPYCIIIDDNMADHTLLIPYQIIPYHNHIILNPIISYYIISCDIVWYNII